MGANGDDFKPSDRSSSFKTNIFEKMVGRQLLQNDTKYFLLNETTPAETVLTSWE